MTILDNVHKRKAAVKTVIIMLLLFISFFFIGMTYLDPPEEKGIEILMADAGVNYGTSQDGSGEMQPMTTQEPSKQSDKNLPSSEEKILTQDNEEAPVVKSNPTKNTKPTEPKKPTPEKSTTDALNNILGATSNTNNNATSEGDGKGNGDKGQIDGNAYSTAYYGSAGSGAGFGLKGRSKTSNQKFMQECNEEGLVVVRIEVDNSGKVINAVPGVQGTENSAPCLMEPARKTALSYRFNPDPRAPTRQIGFVAIKFSLGQ